MTKFTVHQHWDPLEVCVVGRSYPPEYYDWINVPRVRDLFEKIAVETEEDYQAIIKKLEEFNVEILRPKLPSKESIFVNGKYLPPPMTPRDHMIMIGDKFYETYRINFKHFYQDVKDDSWPICESWEEFKTLPSNIRNEVLNDHGLDQLLQFYSSYDEIYERIESQGNQIKNKFAPEIGAFRAPGAFISRIGKDLYYGTETFDEDSSTHFSIIEKEFPNYRNHIVKTGGHGDGVYCPIAPGLIISLHDMPTYEETFPGWEIVYLPNQSWELICDFLYLKAKNKGKWWIPGFERDDEVINVVETWLGNWVGYVEETVFDVNMLIIDPKNVIVFNYNKIVFDALERYGITPHVIPFRHRFFWDGGIHCVTADLSRRGTLTDYFPERS